ncbi:hypothetical protein HYS49_01375 [Candidatus Woesearchaeota archaeon]|nr:hypothetical protein [Candidatus Woesearchaeota archaeon]
MKKMPKNTNRIIKKERLGMTLLLALLAMMLPAVTAQIAIGSFAATPKTMLPGNAAVLTLTVENGGDEDIENVAVALDLTQVPFAPVDSSTEKIIAEIDEDGRETLSFTIKALPDAKPGTYKIPVTISHDGTSKTSLLGIEVKAPARLEAFLEKSELLMVQESGEVTIKIVNSGLSPVTFLKVTLLESPAYDILSPAQRYIGDVDIGDFETEEFMLLAKAEDPILALELEYRNAQNQRFTASALLEVPVYSAEEAQRLGLVKKNALLPVIVSIIMLVGAVLVYKKLRKMKKAKQE